jgi:6-phosphogluconolactonase (cycloisomerase 2 family)
MEACRIPLVDRDNYIIVADQKNNCIRLIKWNDSENNVTTLAGKRGDWVNNLVPLVFQSIDGLSKKARFNFPTHLSFDNSGQLVVVCLNNSGAVRIVDSLNSSFDAPRHTD